MKIALPTLSEAGLDAALCSHFGQAAFFTTIDSDTGEVTCEPNHGEHHGGQGQRTPAQVIAALGTDAVICGGLGSRAVQLFSSAGIQVFSGANGTVQEALEAHRTGQLQEATAAGACPDGESCH